MCFVKRHNAELTKNEDIKEHQEKNVLLHFQISSEGVDMEGNTILLNKFLFYQIIY